LWIDTVWWEATGERVASSLVKIGFIGLDKTFNGIHPILKAYALEVAFLQKACTAPLLRNPPPLRSLAVSRYGIFEVWSLHMGEAVVEGQGTNIEQR
jgi:hypothetical protein